MEPIAYRIDAEDRLVEVNQGWRATALLGTEATVPEENVVGRKLWDSIADPTTINLYRGIVVRARAGHAIHFRYRCDTPTQRRLYLMEIKAEASGHVSFTSVLTEQEERPSIALLETHREQSSSFVRMCSWCQRVALPSGEWVLIEDAVMRLQLMESGPLPGITHGICESCADRMMRAMAGAGDTY